MFLSCFKDNCQSSASATYNYKSFESLVFGKSLEFGKYLVFGKSLEFGKYLVFGKYLGKLNLVSVLDKRQRLPASAM